MADSSFIAATPAPGGVDVRILTAQIGERESQIIQDEIARAASPVGWRVAIDMSGVTFLASAGLGALVSAHNAAKGANGKMAVYNLAPELLAMLKLTHLDRLFTIKPDRAAALKALS
jgi:anti-anti-sigma factor